MQGIFPLLIILGLLGFSVQAMHRVKCERIEQRGSKERELQLLDTKIALLDQRIQEERRTPYEIERFYSAWVPEIDKCRDPDSLIAAILVEAYRLNLVPLKKELMRDQEFEFRGRDGKRDRIRVRVAGRYDRLVRFVDQLRQEYPFMRIDNIEFSVAEANVQLELGMSSCQLNVPESDLLEMKQLNEAEEMEFVETQNEEGEE